MIVHKDHIASSGAITNTKTGTSDVRGFLVEGASGPGPQRKWQALNAPGIPRPGDPHPVVAGVFCSQVSGTFEGSSVVRVEATYEVPELEQPPDDDGGGGNNFTIEVSTTVVAKTTERTIGNSGTFADGEQVVLKHTYVEKDENERTIKRNPQTTTQGGELEVLLPQTVLTATKNENEAATAAATKYVGAVNSSPWQGAAARMWLCTEITSRFEGGGLWQTRYVFQLDRDTWDSTAVFIDPQTGRPPEGLVKDLGYKTGLKVYREEDFGGIGL